ncbi:MAG: helicase-associated domain-containing protein [Ktedonobacteraceae bacterium]
MEQNDLDLLQTVPSYHLQTLIKTRRLPLAAQEPGSTMNREPTAPDAITSPPERLSTEIGEHLFAPEAVADALSDISDLEQLILRELVACGGRANSRDLALYFTKARLLDSGKDSTMNREPTGQGQATAPALYLQDQDSALYPTPHPHGPYEQALHHLLVKGLLFWGRQTNFAGRDYTNGVYDGVLIVPYAVRQAVCKQVDTAAEQTRAEAVAMLFDENAEGVRAFQRTLYLYWSIVSAVREGLSLVSSGMLARSALRQITDALDVDISPDQVHSEMDVPRLLFVRLLLQQLGLLRVRNSMLQGAPAEDFFALPLPERLRRCTRAWLHSPFWDELAFLPNVAARPGPQPLDAAHEEVVRSRQMVVERLLQEAAAWQDIFAFIARAKLYMPYLLFPRQYGARADRYSIGSNPYGWDFRLRQGWLTPREGWYLVEGGFIRALLLGPLHWLGLIETRLEGHVNQFRVSPHLSLAGADEAATGENESPPLSGKLIVQPNFELIVLAPVSEGLLVKLDRFAERVKLEHIAQYRLTKASVTRAIQLGLHVEDILPVLQGAADPGIDIPQNVRYSLAEWERQARRVELWQNAALIEVDDPALLDSLLADEATRALFRRRLSSTLAEAVASRLPALQAVLWQRDYLPAITPAPEQDALGESERRGARGPQWQLRDDGLLRPLYTVVDLYLAAEVAQFTTRDEQTSWPRITPATIQHAIESGLALSAIIRFLQAYGDGGVPPSFLMRLRLWGGGYGEHSSIRVEQMPMLYLSEQALQDVRADDALRVLLDAAVPAEGRLVRVPHEHLEQVIALLKERGFTVD